MRLLNLQITSRRTDGYIAAAIGTVCIAVAVIFPSMWTPACIMAAMINLINAHRLLRIKSTNNGPLTTDH
jgi:hypothetical protein